MRQVVTVLAAAMVLVATSAFAQTIGTFRWQLQPFCNVVSIDVTQQGAHYRLDGFDDQCGAAQRAPLVGLATLNPDSTIGLGLNLVTVPGGRSVHVDARITLAQLGGPWSDSAGNSGTFVFNGAAAGLPPRPVPPGVAPGSVTSAALAPGAVTAAAIADGTIGAADVNSAEVQRRIATTCAAGLYFTGVSATGAPTCSAGPLASGSFTVALGPGAGNFSVAGFNTAIGQNALRDNTNGQGNTALGFAALQASIAASGGNTAVGASALPSLTTGFWNTAIGEAAALNLRAGTDNTVVGRAALLTNVNGANNTAVGGNALFFATGSANIAIGKDAGSSVTIGSSNILIGSAGASTESLTTRIGSGQTRAFMAGIRGVTTATAAIPVLVGTDGQLGTTSSSRRFKEDIADMGDASSRVFQLRPVTFRFTQAAADGSKPLDFGLIAEEVAEVFPELAVAGADGRIETVAYHKLPALLLNELQKQQKVIAEQAKAIDELRRRLDAMTSDAKR